MMKRKAIAYRLRAIADRLDPPTIEQLAEYYDTHDTSYELNKAARVDMNIHISGSPDKIERTIARNKRREALRHV
ncbi:hypothetical protein ACHIPZ_13780 [Antrihabitans sp. NCIMB 15449]|uniref:Uncharacterized protein n=1 Tax=Antrihabitans spumae TaxID=3373370 RepID=A0ABW7JMR0_9NOCA